MNNWRLLLLAVVAVLQPIGSFTEPNFIDGQQECCEHRSNSVTQETRLYGTYRKTTPEERRLSTREDNREERRYESRNDPLTRSRVRLSLERAEKRISPESSIRFSAPSRFARDQERRQRTDATEYRQTREDQNRRTQSKSKDSVDQYGRDVLDSRRIARDDITTRRIDNERLYRESFGSRDARRVRISEDLRRVSATRETMAILGRERDDVARDAVRRDSRISALRSISSSQLNNNRDRHTLDQGARDNSDENRRSRSLDSRANTDNEQENFRSRIDSREDRRSNFRAISERANERRQRDQNRESRDRSYIIRRDTAERISEDRSRESRDIMERVERTIRDIRGIDEHQQRRDSSQRRSPILRESRLTSAGQALTRQSRILDENMRPERILRRNSLNAIRETSKEVLRASRDGTFQRRQESRVLEATVREEEKLERSDERRHMLRKLSTRSLDQVAALRSSRVTRFLEREYVSRDSARFPERNVRDERSALYHRDARSVERLEEQKEQRDESRMSSDRTTSMLRESRDSAERRQESRSTASLPRFEAKARSERDSRIRRDIRHREIIDVKSRNDKQTLHHMIGDKERRHDRELSRTARRASSDERVSRLREDIRSERLNVQRETRYENRASRDLTVVMQRVTRDIPKLKRKTSRNVETNARLQRTRSLEDNRNNRGEMHERDESRISRDNERRLDRELSRTAGRASSDERVSKMREDSKNEQLNEQLETRYENRASRDRTVVMQRVTRDISTLRLKASRNVETNARLQRTRYLEDNRNNRGEVRERDESRMSRDNERRLDRELSRTSGRASSDERVSKMREDSKNEPLNVQRETRYENRASRDRTVVMQRVTRVLSTLQQKTSQNVETYARLQRTRSLEGNRNNRGEVRERDENRMSRDNERRLDRELSRTAARASSDERVSKMREDSKNEQLNEQRETRYENRASRDRTVIMQRVTRVISTLQQKTSRNVETNARLQRTRSLEDNRNNRGEVRERDENRMSRDNERRIDHELSRTAGRASSDERVSKMREYSKNEPLNVQRETRYENRASRDRTVVMQRVTRDISTLQQKASRNVETNARLQRTRSLEDNREDNRREVRERYGNRVSRDNEHRLNREMSRTQERTSSDERVSKISDRGDARMGERFEVRRQQDRESRFKDHVTMQRQARDILVTRTVEQKPREVFSRNSEMDIRSERLSRSRDDNRINERDVRGFRTVESRRDSRKTTEREIQPTTRHNFDKHSSHDIRIEAKLRSTDILLAKQMRTDTRRDAIDTRFRNVESPKVREMDTVEMSYNDQNSIIWQVVFYTMQGAYLCGLFTQMLTEKSNKGKSRNFSWWSSSPRDVLKID